MNYIKLFIFLFGMYSYVASANDIQNCSAPPSISISASGTFSVQRDAAISVISPWFSSPDTYPYTKCMTTVRGLFLGIGIKAANQPTNQQINVDGENYAIFSTSVDGIGYINRARGKFAYTAGGYDSGWLGWWPYPNSTSYSDVNYVGTNANMGYNTGLTVQVAFVKYAQSQSGMISGGVISYGTAGMQNIYGNPSSSITLISSVVINTLACTISTPSLTFPIGDISASQFSGGAGTIPAGAQSTVNLGLNCSAGANINVSLAGTQNPDVDTPSVLALTGQGDTGVAKGVGVQIVYNDTPLDLNTRIVLKQSSGGQETFPLTARYYQTQSAVSPGTANASATLNLTYQ